MSRIPLPWSHSPHRRTAPAAASHASRWERICAAISRSCLPLSPRPAPSISTHCSPSRSSARALKIGWVSNAWKSMEPGVGKVADTTEKSLRKFFPSVKHVLLPPAPYDDAANVTMEVECVTSFRELIRSGRVSELADPLCQINGYVNEQFSG